MTISTLRRTGCLAILILLALAFTPTALAQGANPGQEAAFAVPALDADAWRQVKAGETGPNYRDSRFDSDYNLINASGEVWRQWRNRWVSPFGVIAIGAMVVLIALFYLIVGSKRLEQPRTGRKLLRWPLLVRSLHWTVATLFIVLALTGLNLLYGKATVSALLGDAAWGSLSTASKVLHNYLGPLFGILLVVLLLRLLRHNWPTRQDLAWFRQGGGLVGKKHIDAGFANGGEKLWFWLLATAGIAVIVSGLVLDFPNFGQGRDTMQWANLIHGVGALGLTAVALGHIYIGTIGSEGSIEGMTRGYVDESWAKQHHNLWYEEVKDQAVADETVADARKSPSGDDQPAPGPG